MKNKRRRKNSSICCIFTFYKLFRVACNAILLAYFATLAKQTEWEKKNKNRNQNKKQVLSIRTNKRFNTDYEFEWIDSQTLVVRNAHAMPQSRTAPLPWTSFIPKKGSEGNTLCEYAPYISYAVCASIYPYPTLLWFSWRSSIFFFRVGWQPSGVLRCTCNTRNWERISVGRTFNFILSVIGVNEILAEW